MRFCAILLSTGEGQNSFCTETSIGFKNTIFCLKKRQDIPNFRFAILHEEMNALKRMNLIRMTTGYFLRRRTTYHSFPGPLHFPIWQLRLWAFRITNSSPRYASLSQIYVGCPPPPPILGLSNLVPRVLFPWGLSGLPVGKSHYGSCCG